MVLPVDFFQSLPPSIQQLLVSLCEVKETLSGVDMVVSVGGDGTFLRTAQTVGDSGIPVLGINTGRLGFLAAINYVDVDETLEEVMKEYYRVEERALLKMSTDETFPPEYFNEYALNEVAILKQDTASMLSIHAYINNDYLFLPGRWARSNSHRLYGLLAQHRWGHLIAYNSCIILSAIAPHNLTSRSLVVDDSSIISIKVESRSHVLVS